MAFVINQEDPDPCEKRRARKYIKKDCEPLNTNGWLSKGTKCRWCRKIITDKKIAVDVDCGWYCSRYCWFLAIAEEDKKELSKIVSAYQSSKPKET